VDSATCEVQDQELCWTYCNGENPPNECSRWCEKPLLGAAPPKAAGEFDFLNCHLWNGSVEIERESFIQFADPKGEVQMCLCFGNDKLSCYGTGETQTVTPPTDLQPGVFAGCMLSKGVPMAGGASFNTSDNRRCTCKGGDILECKHVVY